MCLHQRLISRLVIFQKSNLKLSKHSLHGVHTKGNGSKSLPFVRRYFEDLMKSSKVLISMFWFFSFCNTLLKQHWYKFVNSQNTPTISKGYILVNF